MAEPRIALIARTPGPDLLDTAAALAEVAEVTVVAGDECEDGIASDGVRVEPVSVPGGDAEVDWYDEAQLWSALAREALVRLYPGGGPDLAEFPDRRGEGAVTAQAIQTADPALRRTTLCVRLCGTSEIEQVLDGFIPADRATRMVQELERYALAGADRLLWPGGGVLDTYRRFYGEGLATPFLLPPAARAPAGEPAAPEGDGPVAFLFSGPLARRQGVLNLIRAVTALEFDDWTLTLAGPDTDTAPLGGSMREQLELMIAGDPRIDLAGELSEEELGARYDAADVIVAPALWDCWPRAVLDALGRGRPVLATPVGGHPAMVEPGRSGWLAADPGPDALATALEQVISGGRRLGDGPAERFRELADPGPLRDRYLELAGQGTEGRGWSTPPAAEPLVSVVVPYFRMEAHVEETLASIRDQTHGRIEVVLVNDGSLRAEDAVVEELAGRYGAQLITQPNSGLGAARNLGIELARGRYVLPVDPDDTLLPGYVERCVDVLERRPELAYVTSWTTYIDEEGNETGGGYRPLGNGAAYLETENVAGSAMAVFRRRLFERGLRYSEDMTSYEDWLLFCELRDRGQFGHVIPEPLLRYRVRSASMLRGVTPERLALHRGELEAHRREAAVRWTAG